MAFIGSHPPAVSGAQLAAIDVLETEPEHVKKLWDNTKYFKKELKSWVLIQVEVKHQLHQ